MAQIHKKFTVEQVKVLLASYENGHIGREEIQSTLGVGKTRFFALLKQFRESLEGFTIEYHRKSKGRLSQEAEEKIHNMLFQEKDLVENKELPISNYNYAALADRLKKVGVQVSSTTVIKRASLAFAILGEEPGSNQFCGNVSENITFFYNHIYIQDRYHPLSS